MTPADSEDIQLDLDEVKVLLQQLSLERRLIQTVKPDWNIALK